MTLSDRESVLLFVQGRLRPGGEEAYAAYLKGTGPLMAEYGARVAAVGSGLESELMTASWPLNAVLEFKDQASVEAFLSDPRYVEIKEAYRDAAYETLHLSLVAGRPTLQRTPRVVALEAFEVFRTALGNGEWEPFLARLSDDVTVHFPRGPFRGLNRGKERARQFFSHVSETFPGGLSIDEIIAVTAEDDRVLFEFRDGGTLRGEPYENQVALSFTMRGEQISAYREYFGLLP